MSIRSPHIDEPVRPGLGEWPAVPPEASEIIRPMISEGAVPPEVVQALESEPATRARILGLARSGVFRSGPPPSCLRDALDSVGPETFRLLVLTSLLLDAVSLAGVSRPAPGGLPSQDFWRHSVAVGICAKRISEVLNFDLACEAFVAGLLHDVGTIVLSTEFSIQYREILESLGNQAAASLARLEQEAFGIDHAQIGALVLRRWSFPQSLVYAVEKHHGLLSYQARSSQTPSLTTVVAAANTICNANAFPIDTRWTPQPAPRSIPEALSIPETKVAGICAALESKVHEVGSLLGLDPGDSEAQALRVQEENDTLLERNRSLEREIRQISLLYEVTQGLCSTLKLPNALDSVSRALSSSLPVDALCTVLYEPHPPEMHINLVRPLSKAAFHQIIQHCKSEAALLCGKTPQTARLRVVCEGQNLIEEHPSVLDSPAYLVKPIRRLGVPIGIAAIAALGGTRYSDRDAELFETIAGLLGLALENISLHERVTRDASHDPLTQLSNRRAFFESLRREFSRACRLAEPLSLLLLDLDHFKKVNDQHGHTVGDQVLIGVAEALEKGLRGYDTAARYGGEEFAILLPKADSEAAAQVGKRLLTLVSVTTYRGRNSEEFSVAMSGGLTTFPDNQVDEAEAMIGLADRALYEAKAQGGNRIVEG